MERKQNQQKENNIKRWKTAWDNDGVTHARAKSLHETRHLGGGSRATGNEGLLPRKRTGGASCWPYGVWTMSWASARRHFDLLYRAAESSPPDRACRNPVALAELDFLIDSIVLRAASSPKHRRGSGGAGGGGGVGGGGGGKKRKRSTGEAPSKGGGAGGDACRNFWIENSPLMNRHRRPLSSTSSSGWSLSGETRRRFLDGRFTFDRDDPRKRWCVRWQFVIADLADFSASALPLLLAVHPALFPSHDMRVRRFQADLKEDSWNSMVSDLVFRWTQASLLVLFLGNKVEIDY